MAQNRRGTCPDPDCAQKSFVEQDPTIGPPRALLTSRAARWATIGVGRRGRPVEEVAEELGGDWHAVNDEVRRWGEALLEADGDRVGKVEAVGVDKNRCSGGAESSATSSGVPLSSTWATASRFDIVLGKTANSAEAWFRSQSHDWLGGIHWAVLDMSGPYRTVYDRVLPNALQVADPFHVLRLAKSATRRSTQTGPERNPRAQGPQKNGPLYRIRRLLTSASERISDRGRTRLRGLLDAGDPHGEVRTAWHATETVRGIYEIDRPAVALRYTHPARRRPPENKSCPPEVNKLGRTIGRWGSPITNWHLSKVTNRCHRSSQQPDQTRQTSSVRVPQLRQLPNTGSPVCGETQLGPTPRGHSPVKCDEPLQNHLTRGFTPVCCRGSSVWPFV